MLSPRWCQLNFQQRINKDPLGRGDDPFDKVSEACRGSGSRWLVRDSAAS